MQDRSILLNVFLLCFFSSLPEINRKLILSLVVPHFEFYQVFFRFFTCSSIFHFLCPITNHLSYVFSSSLFFSFLDFARWQKLVWIFPKKPFKGKTADNKDHGCAHTTGKKLIENGANTKIKIKEKIFLIFSYALLCSVRYFVQQTFRMKWKHEILNERSKSFFLWIESNERENRFSLSFFRENSFFLTQHIHTHTATPAVTHFVDRFSRSLNLRLVYLFV